MAKNRLRNIKKSNVLEITITKLNAIMSYLFVRPHPSSVVLITEPGRGRYPNTPFEVDFEAFHVSFVRDHASFPTNSRFLTLANKLSHFSYGRFGIE